MDTGKLEIMMLVREFKKRQRQAKCKRSALD